MENNKGRESQVSTKLENQHQACKDLLARISTLEGRLSQILNESVPECGNDTIKEVKNSVVPLAGVIQEHIDMIRSAVSLIESITSRLEI